MRGRRRGAIAAAALGLASWTHMSARADPTTETAPPLPIQPGVTAPDCVPPVSWTPGSWSVLQQTPTPDATTPQPEYAVDPWHSCRWYRAADAHTVQRSVDLGHSWQTIFSDAARGVTAGSPDPACPTACVTSTAPFTGTGLVVPQDGALAISEGANGDGLVVGDAGRGWRLANGDGGSLSIAGQAIARVVFAPGNPSVAYAIPSQASAGYYGSGVEEAYVPSTNAKDYLPPYYTSDGGATWHQSQLPISALDAQGVGGCGDCSSIGDLVAVDPRDPSTVWTIGYVNGTPMLFTGSGYGQSWTYAKLPAGIINVFLASQLPDGHVRLYLAGDELDGYYELMVSDDEGQSWKPRGAFVEAGGYAPSEQLLAADPANPEKMLLIRYPHHAYWSSDGGTTWTLTATPPGGHAGADHPALQHWSGNPYDPGGMPVSEVLQADRQGNFYLLYSYTCRSDCPSGAAYMETWARYTPPDATVPAAPVIAGLHALVRTITGMVVAAGGVTDQAVTETTVRTVTTRTTTYRRQTARLTYEMVSPPALNPLGVGRILGVVLLFSAPAVMLAPVGWRRWRWWRMSRALWRTDP